jgi:hypothetical protein
MDTTSTLEPPAPMSAVQRLMGVFFQPKAAFADIVARPGWILPIILLCLGSLAVTFTFTQHVGWRNFMEKQFAQNSRVQQLSPEQREQALQTQIKIAPMIGYGIGTVGILLSAVILAAIGLASFNLTAGAQLKFRTCMSIVAYGWMPLFLAGLLSIAVIFLRPPDMVDIQNLLASNPGALLADDAPKWQQTLLGSLDIFSIWCLILMALGFSAANPRKITFGRAFFTLGVLWILFIAVKVGWALVFA